MSSVCFWRSFGNPLKTDKSKTAQLALVDRKTVKDQDCVRRMNVGNAASKKLGSMSLKQNDAHIWYYYPDMSPDEVVMFTQFEVKKEPEDVKDSDKKDNKTTQEEPIVKEEP